MPTTLKHKVFICCVGGWLNPHGEGSKELYDRLELDRYADDKAIKAAYRKLSLKKHPDAYSKKGMEVTKEIEAEFQKLQEAKEILADPEKRKLYDELGINGLKLYENPQEFLNPELVAEIFKNSSTMARCSVFSGIMVVLSYLLLWPVLFSLRSDGSIDGSWVAVWTPLWIMDAAGFVLLLSQLTQGPQQKPEDWDEEVNGPWTEPEMLPFRERIEQFGTHVLWILFELLLCLRLDETITTPWALVLIPYFIYEGIQLFQALYIIFTPAPEPPAELQPEDLQELDPEQQEEYEKDMETYIEAIMTKKLAPNTAVWVVAEIIQILMIALKAEGTISANWWLVLLPLWLFVAFRCSCCCLATNDYFAASRQRMDPQVFKNDSEEAYAEAETEAWNRMTSYLLGACCMSVFIILLGLKLTSAKQMSVFVFFIPLFVVGCCACCFAWCFFFVLPFYGMEGFPGEDEDGNADPELGRTQTVETAENSNTILISPDQTADTDSIQLNEQDQAPSGSGSKDKEFMPLNDPNEDILGINDDNSATVEMGGVASTNTEQDATATNTEAESRPPEPVAEDLNDID